MNSAHPKIVLVDGDVASLTQNGEILSVFCEVYPAPSDGKLFELLEHVLPELILMDVDMPEVSGYEALKRLKRDKRFADIPVIFLTGKKDADSESEGLNLGVADYINKPFSPSLLLKRVEHQLLILRQNKTIQNYIDDLSVIVGEKIGEVVNLQNAILSTVADLVEFRDKFTGGHIARTQLYLKAMIGGLLEKNLYMDIISDWDMDSIFQSAQLHDVGKIAIPDAILNKPERLSLHEFEAMKTHVTVGIDAVNRIIGKTKSHAFLRHTLNIVGSHHEKWDGTGYPYGLKGEEIPLEGRLMALVDVYDALVSWRPYKEQLSHEQATQIILANKGTHFDPVLVDVYLGLESKFARISSANTLSGSENLKLMTLTRDMEVGVFEIDMQHRELVDRLNDAIVVGTKSVPKEETQRILDFLGEYVIKHFSDEEDLQKQSGYPKYEWHKSQHKFFVDEFQKLQNEFAVNGVSDKFSLKLHNSIIGWITRHIQSVDVEFGKYYQFRQGQFSVGF